jgi:hypothetical protein
MTPAHNYFEAARQLAALRKQQADLIAELDGLVTPIAQAEALTNKTREALLRQVESGQFQEAR